MSKLQPDLYPKKSPAGEDTQPIKGQSAGQILGALSVLLVLLTPVAYLNGRAFHDGWYAYFKLDPYMFPLDTAGILHNAPTAWVNGILALAHIVVTGIIVHWGYVALYLLFLVLIWRAGGSLLGHLKRRQMQRQGETRSKCQSLLRRVLWWIAEPLIGLGISVGALYIMLYGLSMVVILLILPFELVGRHEAKLEVERHFQNMPVVTLKSPKGDQADYHIIGCGPQFCGVFGEGHAITVPVSAITWAVSSPPDNR
jgi:hypothetical protein